MARRPRLLAVVQLPPPYHGVSVANQHLLASNVLEEVFDVEVVPIRLADSVSDLGRLSLRKIIRTIESIHALVAGLRRSDLVYYTPGGWGLSLFRDAMLLGICRMMRVPYVLHLHGGRIGVDETGKPFPFLLERAVRFFIPRAAHIILLGESVYPGYASYLRPCQSFSFVGNGVSLPVGDYALPDGPLRLGFLNNLIRIKGVIHAVRCMALLPSEIHLDVVGAFGGVEYESEIRSEIHRLDLEGRIHFHGAQFGEAAWEKLSRCHCLLYTSDWQEGFPLVWLEAMVRRKVVATFRVGVADEVIGRLSPQLVKPIADVQALAEVLRELYDNRACLVRLSNAGREMVEQEFTVEAWSRRVAGALKQAHDTVAVSRD